MKLAVELDALADTRALWQAWLADAARRFASIAGLDTAALPEDRGAAAEELDRWAESGVGDWRAALERFAENHAPSPQTLPRRPCPALSVHVPPGAAAGR